mgnify:CR=1 FL=1
MDKQRVLVTTAWPYASGVPHLGNLVGSLMSGDVFARYYRLRGKEVRYVSGTDAHGTRIEYEAERKGISPAELAETCSHSNCIVLLPDAAVRSGSLADNGRSAAIVCRVHPLVRRFVR